MQIFVLLVCSALGSGQKSFIWVLDICLPSLFFSPIFNVVCFGVDSFDFACTTVVAREVALLEFLF